MKSLGNREIEFVLLMLVIIIIAGSYKTSRADFTFGSCKNLGHPVNTSRSDGTPCISPDGLSLYFTSNRSGGSGSHDLWVATRATKEDSWSSPTNLGRKVNSSSLDYFPCISADGLSLYFYSARAGGRGGGDIWVTTRLSVEAEWGYAVNLGPAINSNREEVSPNISQDGLRLIFASDRAGGYGNYDLYISTRTSTDSTWSIAVNLGPPINSPHLDVAPSLSSDGLALFFHSIRPGGLGNYDIYFSRRASLQSEWSALVNIGAPVNSSYSELGPSLSGDGCSLYWSDHYINPPRPGGLGTDDIWQVSIEPVVDLNGDGIVDASDMCIIVDYWGTDESLCDIGPMPWGDGIVDVQDLIILSEHLFEEIFPPELIAYWKFDETEGAIAYELAGGKDGYLFGDPVWQSAEGKKDGALQFDGVNDYVLSILDLNPADGPFSVFSWIKGGAPGQVIISQMDGTGNGETWIGMDIVSGCLMTGLVPPPVGRFISQPLKSQHIISNDKWHHIGFVWDGSYRSLYVDGTEVATDTNALAPLKFSDGGLYIGTSKVLDTGSFFSGMIDDIRIYDVALSAEEIAILAQ
jgi:Tol biopolymer transport system component